MTSPGSAGRISVVEAQRRTGIPGPELIRAIISGEISAVDTDRQHFLVDPDEIEAWAARRPAAS